MPRRPRSILHRRPTPQAQNPATFPMHPVFPIVSLDTCFRRNNLTFPTSFFVSPVSKLNPANYPPLDKPPPTDSPEVLQWIQEVQQSGVTIPNISTTVTGGCPANPSEAADPSRCWWTCGGCTRPADVSNCPAQYSWGLTYDDGPAPPTSSLLDYLDQVNLRATMFIIGSRAISEPTVLQREYVTGHQIAVHTWSHTALTTQTTEQIIAEIGWTKKVIFDILGVNPIVARPPYGDIECVFPSFVLACCEIDDYCHHLATACVLFSLP